MHVHFFGSSPSPLLGVYHPPRPGTTPATAALICPPIGHEYLRTHWAIRRVANKIARAGIPVMRFDYRGIGDSSGEIWQVATLGQWVDDVLLAADELQSHSGFRSLTIIGLRFGAALAALAAQRMAGVRQLILWEPVLDGPAYLGNLRRMHQQMLDLWVCPMSTENSEQAEEILGSVYQRGLLREIEQLRLSRDSLGDVASTLVGTTIDGEPDIMRSMNGERGSMSCVGLSDIADWHDLRFLETAWLPAQAPALLAELMPFGPTGKSAGTLPAVDAATSLTDSLTTLAAYDLGNI